MAKTVLVIDDDPTQRRLLSAAVEKAGFACRTAPDGETGVAIATDANAGADVVLLDLTMPGLSGMDTLEMLTERRPDLPVVMLSVVGKASTIVECMHLGAVDYLNKPFEEAEREATLDKVLEKKALERERDALLDS